jgi:hypothetical protein
MLGVLNADAMCDTPVQFDISIAAFCISAPTAPMDVFPAVFIGS